MIRSIEQRLSSSAFLDVTVRTLASIVSGVMWFCSCADIDIWPLAWLAMVPLHWAMDGKRPRAALYYAWVCGLVANAGGFYWIVGLLNRFAQLSHLSAVPLYLVLCAYQAVVFALWGYFFNLIRRRTDLPAVWLAPLLMVPLELVIPFIFPWYLAITQAWVLPVIQIADLTGPLGVTFLLLMVNGAFYDLASALAAKKRPPYRHLIGAAAVLLLSLVYGQVRIHQVRRRQDRAVHVTAGVVQANVGITLKGKPGFRKQQLDIHRELSRQLMERGADLLIWPESSYPYYLPRNIKTDRDLLPSVQVLEQPRKPIIFGVITVDWPKGTKEPTKVFNSAMMLDSDGQRVGLYDKKWLLIFGEYIPLYKQLKFMRRFFHRRRMSNFDRGTRTVVFPFHHKGRTYNLAPMICYEDIIPSFGRSMARLKPNLFVNVTNDAWFGETAEPYQHLALSVFRSVEHRIGMIRSVNTGVSAFIDATGKVLKKTPAVGSRGESARNRSPQNALRASGLKELGPGFFTSKAWPQPHLLLGKIPLMEPPSTVYAAVGDLFGYLNLILAFYLVVFFKRNLWQKIRSRSKKGTEGKAPSRRRRGKRRKGR